MLFYSDAFNVPVTLSMNKDEFFFLIFLGFIVNFMSLPVSSGYVTALALVIIVSQLKGIFGLHYDAITIINHAHNFFLNITNAELSDTLMGISCITFLGLFKVSTIF